MLSSEMFNASGARAFCCAVMTTIAAAAGVSGAGSSQALAQAAPPPGIGDALRQSEETRRSAPQSGGAAPLVLPRLVDVPFTLKDKETLLVRRFELDGPALLDQSDVRAVLAPFEHRKLTLTQIYEAADKITMLYRDHGYLVAKALVPAQDARGGVLRIKLVPGSYGTVTLDNKSLIRDSFLQSVLDHGLDGATVIHKDALERTMLLMADLPGGGMPRTAIAPGKQQETSDFVFSVPEGRRVDGYLLADNFGSPYTGRYRLTGGVNVNSPLGIGDRLSAFGIVTQDTDLLNGRIAYALPLGYSGLRAEVGALRTTYVLGGAYRDLDASGTADAITATLSYPVRRQRDDTIVVLANFTHKALNDNVLGVSTADRSIDLGTATLLRETVGTLFDRPLTTSAMFGFTAGQVAFNDAAQRALNLAGADTVGNFYKLNLTLNATIALTEKWSLAVDARAQKSLSGNLDSSEQMALTGIWGVRSFDEGLSGDSGYVLTPELRYALPEIAGMRHMIGAFTDIGAVWLEDGSYTTLQRGYTQLNDAGISYNANYEYLPGRNLLLKAMLAQTYGGTGGGASYDRHTKGLLQVGLTF